MESRQTTSGNSYGDNLDVVHPQWTFAGSVAENFVDHISRSVPCYSMAQDIISDLCLYFARENANFIDIGCSTGELSRKVAEATSGINGLKVTGIDSVPEMIEKASLGSVDYNNLEFCCTDILSYQYPPSAAIFSYYTIQFIHPSVRQEIYNNIYQALEWGGGFFLFEKVRAPDARFQDMMSVSYNKFKIKQGYTPDQIITKTHSLVGVLEPFTTQANIDFATRAGFRDYMVIFRHLCFEGILFVK